MSLFTELKRRNVFRVGIAYLVSAWLLAQVADIVLDVLGAPPVVLRSLVALLALGLIPTVMFAWVYEMTPQGVRKASEVVADQSITHHTGKKLDVATIVLLIIAIAFVAAERFLPDWQEPEPVATERMQPEEATPGEESTPQSADTGALPASSIAVLPFANRSNQEDDLYFTDGVHDDLLTQLAKIHDLTVIARTSVMKYREEAVNIREIGEELNVGTVLEGGVQKVGNRVRINAQLIDVATGGHLWAETFDRELTAENVFDLQTEIARKIVQAIAVQLSPEEERLLAQVPTQNLAAYESYLKARNIYYGANYSRTREVAAEPYLQRAIELDPDYADAYILLANLFGQKYWRGVDTSEELLTEYRQTLEHAAELDPGSPGALRARANYYYRVENDYARSLALLQQAVALAPGNVDVHGEMAFSLRRLGRWDESIASFRRALELDPANSFYRSTMLETMSHVWKWQDIRDNSDPLDDADPDEFDTQVWRAYALFNLTGDFNHILAVFERMPPVASSNYANYSAYVHMFRRDPDRAIEVLNNEVWDELAKEPDFLLLRLLQLGDSWSLKGDAEKASEFYEQAVAEKDMVLSSSFQTRASSGSYIVVSLAKLGRFEEALALADELVADYTEEKDALIVSWPRFFRARARGLAGDRDGAIADLEFALNTPGITVTAWDLHYDPSWDFMRDDPRFVELATPDNLIQ